MAVDPQRLAEVFDAVVELPPAARERHLAEACAGDPALRAALDELLRWDAAPDALPEAPPLVALADEAPTRLGRYEVLGPLGAGGMSVVFAARDPVLGRTLAVKLLHGPLSAPGRALLLREGQALAALSHPNVVQIHDLGEAEGRAFLAMELVEGQTLRTWLEGQPLEWRARLPALLQAARGLAAVHAAGLVHGDIKPENILVGADGRVRVVDFGLARLRGEGEPGAVVGTPRYMAPEQFRGHPADAATDQFGFCAVLYLGLFGRPPFRERPTVAQTAEEALSGRLQPPPADLEIAPRVVAAVMRGLQLDRARRWPDVSALADALAAALQRDPDSDLSIASAPRRGLLLAAAAIVGGVDLFVHLRGFGRVVASADDLLRLGGAALLAVVLAVAVAWPRLRRTRINRLVAQLFLGAVAAMCAHRLLGARLGHPPAEILAGDLLVLGACTAVAGLTVQRWLLAASAVFLAGAAVSAIDLDAAPAAMSLGTWSTVLLALVYLRPRA